MGNQKSKPTARKPKRKLLGKLHKLVPSMNLEEIKSHWDLFHHHTGGKSDLTLTDFIEVYRMIFGEEAKVYAERMFKAFDCNGDGKVNFEEFLIGLSLTDGNFDNTVENRKKKLQFFFGLYDSDKSGQIDREEMTRMVKVVYELVISPEDRSERTPEDLADEIFDEADVNKDGFINFEEFEKAVTLDQTLVNILLPSPQQDTNTEEL